MSDILDDVDIYPLKFYVAVPSLQRIAVTAYATLLWRLQLANESAKYDELCDFLRDFATNLEPCGRLPKRIGEYVEKLIRAMKTSVIDWINHYRRQVGRRYCNEVVLLSMSFDHLVWQVDGSIEYNASVRNLLNVGDVDPSEKCKLACLYCVEEHVKRLWPLADVSVRYQLSNNERYEALMYFWRCYMRNDWSPVRDADAGEDLSAERFAIRRGFLKDVFALFDDSVGHYGTWSAMLYLWDRLPVEDRVTEAIYLIDKASDICTRYLLPRLRRVELDAVLEQTASHILHRLLDDANWVEFATETWTYICGKITDNDKLFQMIDESTKFYSVQTSSTLYALWNASPARFRSYVCQNRVPELVSIMALKGRVFGARPGLRSGELMVDLLRDRDARSNNDIWMRWWCYLVNDVEPRQLRDIMKVCFVNEDDMAKFVADRLANTDQLRRYCWRLVKERCFRGLHEFLEFIGVDAPAEDELVVGVMIQCWWWWSVQRKGGQFGCKIEDYPEAEYRPLWRDFLAYRRCSTEFAASCVLSRRSVDLLVDLCGKLGEFADVMMVVDGLRLDDEISRVIRKRMLQRLFGLFAREALYLNELHEWREFFAWCCGSDPTEVSRVRRKLSGRILDLVLRRCSGEYELDGIDCLLSWCLQSDEQKREFELRRVSRVDEMFLRFVRVGNERAAGEWLRWVFDGDLERVDGNRERLGVAEWDGVADLSAFFEV